MKKYLKAALSFLCLFLSISVLSGCNFPVSQWPFQSDKLIESELPKQEELEKIVKDAENAATDDGVTILPFTGDFTLTYAFDYESDALQIETGFTQKITMQYPGGGDHTTEPYTFNTTFTGVQDAKVAALNQGVYCWTTMKHNVEYTVAGVFDPVTCAVTVKTFQSKLLDSQVTGTECPAIVLQAIVPKNFYIPPSGADMTISKQVMPYFAGDHTLMVTEIHLPDADMTCPNN